MGPPDLHLVQIQIAPLVLILNDVAAQHSSHALSHQIVDVQLSVMGFLDFPLRAVLESVEQELILEYTRALVIS